MKTIELVLFFSFLLFRISPKTQLLTKRPSPSSRKLFFPSIVTKYDTRIRELETLVAKRKEALNFIECNFNSSKTHS